MHNSFLSAVFFPFLSVLVYATCKGCFSAEICGDTAGAIFLRK